MGADHFGVNRRRCSKQGSSTGRVTVVVSTRQNETQWTVPGHARRSVWRLSRIPWRQGSREWTSQGQCEETKQRALEENAVYEVKVTRSVFTSKDPQQGSEVSQERQQSVQSCSNQLRSTHEDEGYLQTVTSKSTDPVVRSDTTDGTPDADPGLCSDMMAKPQSVVKLRGFGALLIDVVQRVRACIARS